jgi:hypothetical protein
VQHIPSNVKDWTSTQAAMMPGVKMRQKRIRDLAYGMGESSGKKARKE